MRLILFFLPFYLFSQINWVAEYQFINEKFYIKVSFKLDTGFHIYGIEPVEGPIHTQFALESGADLFIVQTPKAIKHFDEGFEINLNWYTGNGTFILESSEKLTEYSKIIIKFQPCTDEYCLAPKDVSLKLSKSSFELPSIKKSEFKKNSQLHYEDISNQSLFEFIGLAISMGFLALLTPCVFPMIPITVSFFTKNGGTTRLDAIKQGLSYGVGIVFIFTLFGFAISQIFGAGSIQNFAANPIINVLIGLLLIVFSLSLLGLFDIRLPSKMLNKINNVSVKSDLLSATLAGIVFSIVSLTCTVQFFGLLVIQATQGEWFYPLIGLFFFSAAFAFPFVLLAIFPQWIAQIPKSGGWLQSTKVVMAFIEIAASIKFFSQADLVWDLEILTRPLMLIIWVLLFFLSTLYLFGILKIPKNEKFGKIGISRFFTATVFLALTIYFASGISGRSLQADLDSYLPPIEYGQTDIVLAGRNNFQDKLNWIEDYEVALSKAKQSGKKLFIDFTGKTCTNCRWMEKKIFTQNDIRKKLERYILVRLWTDFGEKKEFNQNLQQRWFQSVALPYYAIVDQNEKIYRTFAGMTRKVELFKNFLE